MREIGMWLFILIVFFILGQVWFHLVEGVLSKMKSLLNRNKEPLNWHTFEETEDDKKQ